MVMGNNPEVSERNRYAVFLHLFMTPNMVTQMQKKEG